MREKNQHNRYDTSNTIVLQSIHFQRIGETNLHLSIITKTEPNFRYSNKVNGNHVFKCEAEH